MTSPDEALSARLRTETWDAHRAAEHAPFVQDLLAGRLPVLEYARLAAQHHAIYQVLESTLTPTAAPGLAPFLVPELHRLPALEADLDHLAGPGWPDRLPVLPATAAYCDHLRTLTRAWPGGLLAHHYVRYLGDLSGGQLVGRVLQRVYGFDDHRGTDFYRFPAIPSPKAFKDRYRAQLDRLPLDEAGRRRLIDEVNLAYRLNTDVFHDLAPVSTLPGPAPVPSREG